MQPERDLGRLLTVAEVAERLNVTERFVRRIVAERRVAIQKVGRHVRIWEADVDTFLDAGYVPPRRLRVS